MHQPLNGTRFLPTVGFLIIYFSSLMLSACQAVKSATDLPSESNWPTDPVIQESTRNTPSPSPELMLPTATDEGLPVIPSLMPTKPLTDFPDRLDYYAQSGDTLQVVARRFGISEKDISSTVPLPEAGFLPPGQLLRLAIRSNHPTLNRVTITANHLLPDSEVVFSPSAANFDLISYLNQTSGYLSGHEEYMRSTGWTSAAEIIQRVALENSINPRLLLSILEYEAGCVLGGLDETVDSDYLVGMRDFRRKGLYLQTSWVASQLSAGYYGWRTGSLIEFQSPDGIIVRPAPDSNAGSVALLYYFAQSMAAKSKNDQDWHAAINPADGHLALHSGMFGDPWDLAQDVEPLFPEGLIQPELALPFETGRLWSYTSGPHPVWENEGAHAALDFAPATAISGCFKSEAWVLAMADGLVVRSEFGAVVQDISIQGEQRSDGDEHTGWAILYLHIEPNERVPAGTYLYAGDRIGHPSCEGGRANGTHVHIARMYNGEWIAAGGPLPFQLGGWIAHSGSKPYEGTLTKEGKTVIAHPYGSFETHIFVPENVP